MTPGSPNGRMLSWSEYAAADEAFFLWASFFDPHPKYLAPEPWDTMYDPAQVTVPRATPGEHDRNPPHFQRTQEPRPGLLGVAGARRQWYARLSFASAG